MFPFFFVQVYSARLISSKCLKGVSVFTFRFMELFNPHLQKSLISNICKKIINSQTFNKQSVIVVM